MYGHGFAGIDASDHMGRGTLDFIGAEEYLSLIAA
jgi:hypothetical protein